MSRRTLIALGLLYTVGVPGCSSERPAPAMTEVSGRVTINGRPAERVIMNLTPVTPGAGREDECVVERGEFRKQLIPARYKVSFTAVTGGPDVPARYRAPETSLLVLDGTKSEPVNFDLN
jgi:hypothetical protein